MHHVSRRDEEDRRDHLRARVGLGLLHAANRAPHRVDLDALSAVLAAQVGVAIAKSRVLSSSDAAVTLAQRELDERTEINQALAAHTAPLPELSDSYWLVVHPDLKSVPRVRLLIDWIRAAFKEEKSVLQGLRKEASRR